MPKSVGRGPWILAAAVALVSCGGWGDWAEDTPDPVNEAGGSATLEHGGLAVDDVTEMVFVARRGPPPSSCWFCSEGELAATAAKLYGVRADSGDVATVAYLSGLADLRMVFPREGLLVLGERWEGDTYKGDELRLIDRTTFLERGRAVVSGKRFLEPTVSPDGRWVAALEGDLFGGELAVIDADGPDAVIMDGDAEVVGMEWVGDDDRLVVLIRQGHHCFWGCEVEAEPKVRLLSWSVGALASAGFPRASDGVWTGADIDIEFSVILGSADLPFVGASLAVDPAAGLAAFGYRSVTWVGGLGGEIHQKALLVDLGTAAVHPLDGIGSVTGFVPDGGPLAAYACPEFWGPAAPAPCTFVLLDRRTLAAEAPGLPDGDAGSPVFAPGGRRFLMPMDWEDPAGGPPIRKVLLYDVELRRLIDLAGPPLDLEAMTFPPGRDELWSVGRGLFRVDLVGGAVEELSLPWVPTGVNFLPEHGLLVLSESGKRVAFVDPGSGAVVNEVPIPSVY